ncbi:class I SAM-dependent methyltransferase [Streptodolium elevatio]|uniref:Class I SAM-dependent methyltransferase n=1 Tax=Streptodolium elevatio TaxID=3157996 RepID=A0ABV3DUL1_9ACTN
MTGQQSRQHGDQHGEPQDRAASREHAHGHQHDQHHKHDHKHSHSHNHGEGAHDVDWDELGPLLERGAELQMPALEQAAAWLGELVGDGDAVARVLDVGSGPGVAACVLAGAFPRAEVVAVDQADGLLARVRARAAERGLADRLVTRKADLPDAFTELPSADLVWTSDVVHHFGDQQAALRDLAARLRPGGVLAVGERGLPLRFLPRDIGIGRPGLLPRLEVANEARFAAMRAELPGAVSLVEDWPAMLAAAGLVPTGSRTFLTDHPAPLGLAAREQLHNHLTRLRSLLDTELDAQDRETLDRLVDDGAPTGILWRPDAFYLTATTVHTARACASD